MPRGRQPQFKVTLETSLKKYESKGSTLYEALSGFSLKWNQIKAKGVLTVVRGKQSYEHLFFIRQLRGILVNKIVRQTWAKKLELLLNNEVNKGVLLKE